MHLPFEHAVVNAFFTLELIAGDRGQLKPDLFPVLITSELVFFTDVRYQVGFFLAAVLTCQVWKFIDSKFPLLRIQGLEGFTIFPCENIE